MPRLIGTVMPSVHRWHLAASFGLVRGIHERRPLSRVPDLIRHQKVIRNNRQAFQDVPIPIQLALSSEDSPHQPEVSQGVPSFQRRGIGPRSRPEVAGSSPAPATKQQALTCGDATVRACWFLNALHQPSTLTVPGPFWRDRGAARTDPFRTVTAVPPEPAHSRAHPRGSRQRRISRRTRVWRSLSSLCPPWPREWLR
jgi:hypothetical protein